MFEEYLLSFHREELLEIISNKDNSKHFSININFIELHERNIELARVLLNDPEVSLEKWDEATISAQLTLMRQVNIKSELKIKVHCRIHYLAHLARLAVFPGNKDVGKFLQISGTVMRKTAAKLLEYQRQYVCVKCKTPAIVKANYDKKYMIVPPKQCQSAEGCSGTNLVHFGELDSENCKDYQEIKIQEQVTKLGVGSIPNTIRVTLEDDLVDSCQPGDDVTICGIVRRQFGEFVIGKRIEIDLVFKANHVQVDTNSFSISTPETRNMFSSFWEKYSKNPIEGRDIILKSFCPQIYGLYPVKLAIAVVLAGGCPTEDVTFTGVRTRSESHLLMVGDPGTGKSQLLRFASKIVPRAVLTTGVGSTSAGLTVTAIMEHGEWQLEAGALVLADGGICCIDEFNSMKEHDRTTIHEAMEQQTISVAKASMVCKLNTRCSILASCNPKGNLDPAQPLSMNVALPSPLLSRFDLIMLLRDTVNREWDEKVIDYILNGGNNLSQLTDFGIWSISMMQSYFTSIKKFQPKLTEDAEEILSTYYNIQRRMGSRNKARTTVRLLESLVRLSQGHARLMYHEKVLAIDAIYAVFLVDVTMDPESSIFNLNMNANVVFPEKPNSHYRDLLEIVLNKLQLQQILDKELDLLKEVREGILQSRFFASKNENKQNMVNNDKRINIESIEDHSNDDNINNRVDLRNNDIKQNKPINELNKNEDGDGTDCQITKFQSGLESNSNKDNSKEENNTNNKKGYRNNQTEQNILKRVNSAVDFEVNEDKTKKQNSTTNFQSELEPISNKSSDLEAIINENIEGNKGCPSIQNNLKKVKSIEDFGEDITKKQNSMTTCQSELASNSTKSISLKAIINKNETNKKDRKKQHCFKKGNSIEDFKEANEDITKRQTDKSELESNPDKSSDLETIIKENNSHSRKVNKDKTISNKASNSRVSEKKQHPKNKRSTFDSDFDDLIFEINTNNNNKNNNASKKFKVNDKFKNNSPDCHSEENTLDILNLIPGVNDGFNANLDMDWDSVGAVEGSQNSNHSNPTTNIMTQNKLSIFSSSEDVDFDI